MNDDSQKPKQNPCYAYSNFICTSKVQITIYTKITKIFSR